MFPIAISIILCYNHPHIQLIPRHSLSVAGFLPPTRIVMGAYERPGES